MSDDMSRVGGGRHDAAHTTAPAIAATEVKNTTLLDAFSPNSIQYLYRRFQ